MSRNRELINGQPSEGGSFIYGRGDLTSLRSQALMLCKEITDSKLNGWSVKEGSALKAVSGEFSWKVSCYEQGILIEYMKEKLVNDRSGHIVWLNLGTDDREALSLVVDLGQNQYRFVNYRFKAGRSDLVEPNESIDAGMANLSILKRNDLPDSIRPIPVISRFLDGVKKGEQFQLNWLFTK